MFEALPSPMEGPEMDLNKKRFRLFPLRWYAEKDEVFADHHLVKIGSTKFALDLRKVLVHNNVGTQFEDKRFPNFPTMNATKGNPDMVHANHAWYGSS